MIKFANLLGWKVAHFRPGMMADGMWTTAVAGDGKGFPDLIFARGTEYGLRIVVAELKVGKRKPTPEQEMWLAFFDGAGIKTFLWYPKDWDEIEKVLREP